VLLGRHNEREVLDQLIDGARVGRSGALVVRGAAGIGKTALLEDAIELASDLRTVRVAGVESEMELAFAALHQLCSPLLGRLERLPSPQRAALAITFGLSEGAAPDRFLVGLAVLGLLSEAADERPLLCVVDDAHWLDKASAQTLAFVARRLVAESVAMIFAVRVTGDELRGLPELPLEGLQDADAGDLLASVIPWSLDERVSEQVVAETQGNPLALIELTQGLSPAQLAGGFGLPGALPLESRIEERFLARWEALPEDTQRLLLVAAADATGDPALLWRATEGLGIAGSMVEPAEAAGLLAVGTRVRFRHPLVRSAVYQAAPLQERRLAHRALAEATDAETDPDRRAWHLAAATAGPDEQVAAELLRSAERAQARGGLAAAAAFLERAVALTPDASLRADRALAAAQTKVQAGDLDAVRDLLAAAEAGPLSELQQGRAELVRAQLVFVTSRGGDAAPMLLAAAEQLDTNAPELARSAFLDALHASMFAGRLARPRGSLLEVAQAASAARSHGRTAGDLLIDGFAAGFGQGYAAGLPTLREALRTYGRMPAGEQLLRMPVAFVAALYTWDLDACATNSEHWPSLCREAGVLSELPLALNSRAVALAVEGDLTGAASLVEEVQAAKEAAGIDFGPYGAMSVAAFRADDAEVAGLIEAGLRDASLNGEGVRISAVEWMNAVSSNALGRYEQALAAAQRASEDRREVVYNNWALAELIEAAARLGRAEAASVALERLSEMATTSGSEWAIGLEARSRALLGDGEAAESLYREAVERLARTRARVELARAHLVYGEWLRRERRRLDAREQLRLAHEMFTMMGATAFAGRAERELRATGERARKRRVELRDELTAQESQIARLARDGVPNAEIGARLYISRRTVEYHLSKVFTKLDISSRHELGRVLPAEAALVP
jgi:DNA-binding CsgD family transcriptional regulator